MSNPKNYLWCGCRNPDLQTQLYDVVPYTKWYIVLSLRITATASTAVAAATTTPITNERMAIYITADIDSVFCSDGYMPKHSSTDKWILLAVIGPVFSIRVANYVRAVWSKGNCRDVIVRVARGEAISNHLVIPNYVDWSAVLKL